jgi:PAS domain S-box-containing protein
VLSRLKIAVRINLLLVLASLGMLLCAGIGLWALRTQMLEEKRIQLRYLMDMALNDARGDLDRSGGAQSESGRAAFLDNLERAQWGDSSFNFFFVYDYEGTVVWHPDPSKKGINRWNVVYPNGVKMVQKFIEIARSAPSGGFVGYEGPDDRGKFGPKLSHFRNVPELKLAVGVGANVADVDAAFLSRLQLTAFLFAFVMIAIGLAGVGISGSIGGPLSNAVRKITRLASGDLDIAPANAADKSELGDVDKALDVLRTNALEQRALQEKVREQNELLLKQHEEAAKNLRKSEELWRQFVHQAPVAMLILDRNMVHLACSRRWVEVYGIDSGIGRCHYDIFTKVPEHWREAHRRGLAGEVVRADEEAFEGPDGGKRWLRWEVRPWLTSDGTIGGITIMTEDVTDRVSAVSALRENELRMRLAQEAAKAGVWEARPDKTAVWSDTLWKLFDLEPNQCEPSRQAWLSTVHPDDRESVRTEIKRAGVAGGMLEVQWRVNRPEGEPERWLFARGRPLTGASPDHYFGVIIDITEQKLIEDALRDSEMRMRLAQEGAKAGTWEWRLADNSLQWSDPLWDVFNIKKPEGWDPSFEGWAALIHPDERGRLAAIVIEAASLGQPYDVAWRLNPMLDASERWFLSRARPIFGANGSLERYFGVMIEITDQKLAENALRESGLRMRLSQEAARAGAWEWRLADNQIRWVESTWSLDHLVKSEQWEPIAETWRTLIHPADFERVIPEALRSVALDEEFEIQWRLKSPESEPVRWFMTRGKPILGADGSPDRYFGVVIEITQQKFADEALRESEMRMRLAQEAAKAGAWELSLADSRLVWPEYLWSEFGVQKPERWEPTAEAWRSLIHPADRDRATAAVAEAIALGQDIEMQWRLKLPEGESERWLLCRGRPIANAKGAVDRYFGVVIDITEQKLMEQAVRESEMRMRLAQEAARAGMWEWRLADNTVQWPESLWSLLYGAQKPEQWTPTAEAWLSLLHPADKERVSVSIRAAAAAGRETEFQWRFKTPEGGQERWFLSRGQPIFSESGAVDRYFGVVIDITDQKRMEQALRDSDMRMRLAQESAKAQTWEWRLADNSIQSSDPLWKLYGLDEPREWQPSFEGWMALIHPENREGVANVVQEAIVLGQEFEIQWRLNLPEGESERWLLSRGKPIIDANGNPDRYFGVVIDITQQKLMEGALREGEERQTFLLSLNDALRSIDEPAEAVTIAAKMLGQKLNASQVVYFKTDASGEHTRIAHVWNDGLLPDSFPIERLDDCDPAFLRALEEGQTVVTEDVRSDSRWSKPETHALLNRASVVVPFVKDRKIAGFLAVHKRDPYPWKQDEVALAQDVAQRTWDLVERALASQALRESEERQSFLLSLNDAFRSADEPAEAIAIAAKMLGRKLNASQIVYSNFEAGDVSVTQSWRDGVGSDTFVFASVDDLDPSLLEAFATGQTVVVGDVRSDPRCAKPETRAFLDRGLVEAFIVVPLAKDRKVAGVLGVHKREPYSWKKEEISLAQDVAHRTWDLFERALAVKALRESEERQTFLLALNDALRALDDPFEAIAIASEMLGQRLDAAQIVYVKTVETGRPSIMHEWNDGVASGAFAIEAIDDCAPSLIEDLAHGRTAIVTDVRSDPRTCRPGALALFERGSIAAFITVPFLKNGRLAGGLGVHKRAPHAWKAEEITLAQEVAERTWEAVERAHVAQALRESEDRLTFAIEAGEVGSWELFVEAREFSASDRALFFFGLPAGARPTLEEVVERTHPDDRRAVVESLQRAAETGLPYKIEFRSLLADGSEIWLEVRGERRSISGKQVIGGLIQDITEKVNQKEAVERAAKTKSEFLSNMSHELRTPMHAILGYSEICTSAVKEGNGNGIGKYLNNITRAGDRLLTLLNDLLDLAKMEAGRMEYKFERAELKDVVAHTLMELDPLIKAKNLEMELNIGERTDALFDRAHLIQVVINLVSNAIKFSSVGSHVGIEVAEDRLGNGEQGVRFRVVDEGPGIPEDELKAVFDKFVQSNKTKSAKGGTGLGLAICDHIIKAHDGTIWAENAKPRGAAFTFVIPKDREARRKAIDGGQAARELAHSASL